MQDRMLRRDSERWRRFREACTRLSGETTHAASRPSAGHSSGSSPARFPLCRPPVETPHTAQCERDRCCTAALGTGPDIETHKGRKPTGRHPAPRSCPRLETPERRARQELLHVTPPPPPNERATDFFFGGLLGWLLFVGFCTPPSVVRAPPPHASPQFIIIFKGAYPGRQGGIIDMQNDS
jgi:hypothetical protein